jgi:MFS family permease
MGIQSGSADLGAFLAIATTLYIAESTHWTFPLYIWAIVGIIGLLVAILLTQNIDRKYIIVKKETKKQNLKETTREAFSLMKKIKLLLPAFMISGAAWGVVATYLPLLLNERTTLSLPIIGLLVAVWIGIGSISSLSYGRISSRISRKKIILFSYLTLGIMGLLLAYFTNIIIIVVIMVLMGISIFLTYPALFSFVSEITDESAESWTFGITFTFQTGGGTIILFLGGVLSDLFGIWMPFALMGMLSLIMTGLLLAYRKKPIVASIR